MQPSVNVIERVQTSRGEIQLQRRGDHYEIISNGTFLMATYNGESEKLLVSKALEKVPHPKRVVIGGLGVGFSLAEALRFPSVQEVKVIEIEKQIIDWNHTYLSPFSENALKDPRTHIVHEDLLEWITHEKDTYDAICLDIDNGPDWIVTDSNRHLYQTGSLIRLAGMLNPYGVITFWSASQSDDFRRLLEQVFEGVIQKMVPRKKGEDDCVYIASSPRHHCGYTFSEYS